MICELCISIDIVVVFIVFKWWLQFQCTRYFIVVLIALSTTTVI